MAIRLYSFLPSISFCFSSISFFVFTDAIRNVWELFLPPSAGHEEDQGLFAVTSRCCSLKNLTLSFYDFPASTSLSPQFVLWISGYVFFFSFSFSWKEKFGEPTSESCWFLVLFWLPLHPVSTELSLKSWLLFAQEEEVFAMYSARLHHARSTSRERDKNKDLVLFVQFSFYLL